MKFIAIGDTNYDGHFECRFVNGEESHSLYYNLEDWVCTQLNGMFGDKHFYTVRPKELKVYFDTEKEVDVDEAREIYSILVQNGWNEKN